MAIADDIKQALVDQVIALRESRTPNVSAASSPDGKAAAGSAAELRRAMTAVNDLLAAGTFTEVDAADLVTGLKHASSAARIDPTTPWAEAAVAAEHDRGEAPLGHRPRRSMLCPTRGGLTHGHGCVSAELQRSTSR